jgi:hypothetical protein
MQRIDASVYLSYPVKNPFFPLQYENRHQIHGCSFAVGRENIIVIAYVSYTGEITRKRSQVKIRKHVRK